jgi:predicted O-methyltransferase YrrM
VSQEPLAFGKNINVGPLPRTAQSMYQQILAGAQQAPPGSIIYLCEHDVFYHPSHFAKTPTDPRAFYFNQNRYYWHVNQLTFWPAPANSRALSQAVVTREYLIEHCERRLANWTPRAKLRWRTWSSARPNVDVRHGDNLTGDGEHKRAYAAGEAQGVSNLGGWGGVGHFQSKVGYKGLQRGDIVQFLIDLYGYQSYLEIGTKSGDTFKLVRCVLKHGVDPRGGCATHATTSDEFFAQLDAAARYDLVFIDGLHEAEQVKRDIANALAHLSAGGAIVMHDCNPRDEDEQRVPPKPGQRIWTGDVWKAFVYYRRRADLEMYVVDTNNGVGVIRHGQQAPLTIDAPAWSDFAEQRAAWLNLKTPAEFREWERRRA